jgi:hypothetical protein
MINKITTRICLLIAIAALFACDANRHDAVPSNSVADTAKASASKPEPAKIDAERIVTDVMNQQYKNDYDAKNKCWNFTLAINDDELDYCMRPHAAEIVTSSNNTKLYFYASNATDINDDLRYAYDSPDAGLMAAFELSIADDGGWKISANENAMPFGTSGNCGCSDAKFTKLGNDYYGWVFSSGGTWQGITVLDHQIVAPQNTKFKNISAIPEVREAKQDEQYKLAIIDDKPAEHFPVRIEKMRADTKVDERVVEFNASQWTYAVPADF